ncbi:hypothetical protein CN918_30235 [Priestia megaterium]|nr:hypothetical protein CN918_30235 [Priestia megaterium]
MTENKRWVELGSITGKRVIFWIESWRESWKTLLTQEEWKYWGLEKIHDTKPGNIPEWDCKKNLSNFL